MFGSLLGTPIINLPQTGGYSFSLTYGRLYLTFFTAVLGLHAIKDKPVVVNGKIEIRPVCQNSFVVYRLGCLHYEQMMFLALTYDHRLLDGREAVTFLVKVCFKWSNLLTCLLEANHL